MGNNHASLGNMDLNNLTNRSFVTMEEPSLEANNLVFKLPPALIKKRRIASLGGNHQQLTTNLNKTYDSNNYQ